MLLPVRRSSARITTNMTTNRWTVHPYIPCGPTTVVLVMMGVWGSGQGDRPHVNNKRAWSVRRNATECHLNFVVRDCSNRAIYAIFNFAISNCEISSAWHWWANFGESFFPSIGQQRMWLHAKRWQRHFVTCYFFKVPRFLCHHKEFTSPLLQKKCQPFTIFFKSEACFHWYWSVKVKLC